MKRYILLSCLSLTPLTGAYSAIQTTQEDKNRKLVAHSNSIKLKLVANGRVRKTNTKDIYRNQAPGYLSQKPAMFNLRGGIQVKITDKTIIAKRNGKKWFTYEPKDMIAYVEASNSRPFALILLGSRKRMDEARKNPRPDNRFMAFEYSTGLRIIDFQRKRILNPNIVVNHWIASWSPNGRYLAFTTTGHGSIHVFDADKPYKNYEPITKVGSNGKCGSLYKSGLYWLSDTKLGFYGTACVTGYTYIYDLVTNKSILDSEYK